MTKNVYGAQEFFEGWSVCVRTCRFRFKSRSAG
jgi:hypothetical protein